MNHGSHTVAELPCFIREAERLLSADERQDLIAYLSAHPKSGDILEGTSDVGKLRWRRGGRGKRAGVRVVYYYHDPMIPLYLLTLFGKGEKSNLTKSERNQLAELVRELTDIWQNVSDE